MAGRRLRSSRKADVLQRGSVKVSAPVVSDPTRTFPSLSSVKGVAQQAASSARAVTETIKVGEPPTDISRVIERNRDFVKGAAGRQGVPIALLPGSPTVSAATPIDSVARNIESQLAPVLDSVQVGFDPAGGVVDAFYCRVRVILNEDDFLRLKAVRVFRSEGRDPADVVPPSILGVSRMFATNGRKNSVGISLSERTFSSKGQAGVLEQVGIDPIRGFRKSSSKQTIVNPSSATSMSDVQKKLAGSAVRALAGRDVPGIDQSVADDLKTMARVAPSGSLITTQKKTLVGGLFVPFESFGKVGTAQQVSLNSAAVEPVPSGMGEFKEIFLVTPGESNSRRIGTTLREVILDDRSVIRGSRFSYYVTFVDNEMKESRRSEIVTVLVDQLVPPVAPEMAVIGSGGGVAVTLRSSDFLVERFEVYRRESFFLDQTDQTITVVRSGGGVSSEDMPSVKSGWVQLDESPAGPNGTATLIDRRVVPGRTYEYRAYSVDCFGNKSCSPAVGVQHFPAPDRVNDLKRPLITAEVDQRTARVRVGVVNDDPRVSSVFVARREVSLREKTFRAPHEPDVPIFGNVQSSRSTVLLTNPTVFSKDGSWTGHLFVSGTGSVGFVDQTVRYDRSYQYVVYGVDRRGERTQHDFSQVVFVSRNPLVDAPSQFSAIVSSGSVSLEWNDPTLTLSPDDIMGDQERLSNSSVRHMYQLQRKRIGGSSWDSFPLSKERLFEDPISSATPPRYRPSYARLGDTYLYRVAVLQSGALYSNYTDPLVVKVDPAPDVPSALYIRQSAALVKPGFVVLSWDDGAGVVDHWEIHRFVGNNYWAANLVMNRRTLDGFQFEKIADVTLESSRSNARTIDQGRRKDPAVFVGQRQFIDPDVSNGNTYIYKVISVSPFGARSEPLYRAIFLTSRPFEMKARAILSPEELARLAQEPTQMFLTCEVTR